MDRKSVIVLVISFILIMMWPKLMNELYPRKPLPKSTNGVATATNDAATNGTTTTSQTAVTSTGTNQARPFVDPNAPEDRLSVTNENGVYTFTSHGGGLKLVELEKYREAIECAREIPGERRHATLNSEAAVPAMAIMGDDALKGDGVFKLSRTEDGIRAEKQLNNDLYIVKDFTLSSNYLVYAKIRLENRSASPLVLPQQEFVVGTATPIGPHDPGTGVGLFWYDGKDAEQVEQSYFANRTLMCFPGTPRTEYLAGHTNVGWAAAHNQFFTMAAIPEQPADKVVAREVKLPPPTAEVLVNDRKAIRNPVGYETALVYGGTTLQPGQVVERNFTLYAGPKHYENLSRLTARMKNDIDSVMGFGGFFGAFAHGLLFILNKFHGMGLHYGIAIILLTVLIKILFWPLTNASTKSMKRMAALQPQMTALREKYKDDATKMNTKLMEFMRENKVSPLGGCLPILLQIPVFFGFYKMLNSAIELRGVSFLWACDLSQADTIAFIAGFPLNPMPIIMGATMLWQARLTPVSPGMDPMQQKIMKYMPLMFLFILYNMSAGLTLYWTVQNLLTILQTKITKTNDPVPAGKTTVAPPAKRKK